MAVSEQGDILKIDFYNWPIRALYGVLMVALVNLPTFSHSIHVKKVEVVNECRSFQQICEDE